MIEPEGVPPTPPGGRKPETPGPGSGKPDRTWLYVALAFFVFWVVYLAFFGPSGPPPLGTAPGSGRADYGWKVLDLNDEPVAFSRFRGKAVFLNLWATWCDPCVEELPSIARLASNPRLKDVEFVCVSTDDSAGPVRKFLEGKKWSMTFLRATDVPPAFMTDGLPATFLIAPDGRIASSEPGAADWSEPGVVDVLEKLAKSAK